MQTCSACLPHSCVLLASCSMCLQATAAAVVDCTSTDEDAYLCASVTASAEAFAQTVVTAHVEATATAIRGCGCQDSITAFGKSQTFINLVAEATATATASACIQGPHHTLMDLPLLQLTKLHSDRGLGISTSADRSILTHCICGSIFHIGC